MEYNKKRKTAYLIEAIKNAVNKNAWLFLAAAWLYTLSFIFTNYLSYSSSATKVANILSDYIKGQENSFKNILHDTDAIANITSDNPSQLKEQLVTDAQGIFAYQVNDLGNPIQVFWNTNKMAVAPHDLYNADGSYIVNYQNGIFEYIKRTVVRNNTTYFFCSLIPIHWQYFLQNEYLKPSFAVHQEIGNSYRITDNYTGAPVKNSDGKVLFFIREKNESHIDAPGTFSILLRLIALIILFVFINNIAAEIVRNENFISGFSFLIGLFLILRLIIYWIPFPFDYRTLTLFSQSIYYGGPINNSLGNLFFNTILLMWLIIFFRRFYRESFAKSNKYFLIRNAAKYLVFLLIPLFTFYAADIISSLVTNSNISFNAADFFSLNIYSFIGFAIICMLLYVWLYLTGFLLQISLTLPLSLFWRLLLFISCSFFLISFNFFQVQTQILLVASAFLLLVLLFIEFKNNPSLSSLVNSSFFIIWALIATAAASTLIVYQNSISEKTSRVKVAEGMQQDVDSSTIYLIHIALSGLTDDFLSSNFYKFQNEDLNRQIKDSLTNQMLTAYANKYSTHIFSFDDKNQPLYNEDSTSYDIVNSIVENKGMTTGINDLWYFKTINGGYNYIFKKQVYNDSAHLGSLFIFIQSKSIKNTALVPELFKQNSDLITQVDKGYALAIYNKRRLVSSFAGFNFADSVSQSQLPTLKYYFLDSLGYSQLWYNASNDKLIIIAKRDNLLFNFITLFAYLFVLFIVLAFVVHESKRMLEEPAPKFTLRKIFRFNIRTQVQTTIIGLSIFSFLVIGIATISFFIYRFNKNTTTQLISSSQIISNEIKQVLNSDVGSEADFEKRITDIAAMHNTDINFYDKSGNLIVSSQPYIYSKEVLSDKINPEAFNEMHYRHSTRFVHEETIGNFSYQSIYMPVKDENDETIAYLNIPLLSSHTELQEEISDFLITVIILNALIFIFAGAIAVTLTGRITSSLELIGNKMKEINIGSTNEEIPWNTHDEIGTLVEEYNKMVKKLEQSALALVRSEREGAWRQMARQVAHEIKNPLTPMKLSIQYLQRSMESNTANAVKLSKKLASSLIEQIDQLAKIASDFSQFANIEQINPERFSVTEVIQSLVNIYKTDVNTKIRFLHDKNRAEIFYDKAQINRLFTNLVKNAIEAAKQNETIEIFIKQFTVEDHVIISVKDNGNGIKEELQSKIFDPNFTTKTSGTGLGLAICKAIVEKANGKIWFVTAPSEGTIFFVELPMA